MLDQPLNNGRAFREFAIHRHRRLAPAAVPAPKPSPGVKRLDLLTFEEGIQTIALKDVIIPKDGNTTPSAHFTFSTMVIPAGHIGPSHIHYDVEEIFFVMRGAMKVICEKDGERWEAVVGERDLISVPPGVYREEHNIGDEDALMCVMLGSPKPITPTYPPDSPLAKIKRV